MRIMCGIVGVVGNSNATDILLQGLEKLEYRGYDSAGIFVADKDKAQLVKSDVSLSWKQRWSAKYQELLESGIHAGQLMVNQVRTMHIRIPQRQDALFWCTTV